MVRKKILSRAKKNNFKRKSKRGRVQSKRVSKKRTKRSSNKKMRGGSGRRTTVMEPSEIEMLLNIGRDLGYNIPITKAEPAPAVEPAAVAEPAPAVEPAAVAEPVEPEPAPAARPKVNEDEYKKIMKDIKLSPSRNIAYTWEMHYYKNNIFILIFIDEKTKMIKIETMKARYDESIPRAPKGIATHVLYHMVRGGGRGTGLHPGYTINVIATTDESNIESLCRYYENMSFKKDPLHPREGGSQRLKTSVGEFLNNRIDDILIELIEIMLSKGIQNATQLINTLEWRDRMREDRKGETIYNLLRELKDHIDGDFAYISEILSPDDITKMEEIFNLYLSEV